jgi:hypothetical protein
MIGMMQSWITINAMTVFKGVIASGRAGGRMLCEVIRRYETMGLLGKVAAVKAVKGHKEGKEEKKEAEAKTEEKK